MEPTLITSNFVEKILNSNEIEEINIYFIFQTI